MEVLTTTERIEKTRKERIKSNVQEVVDLFRKIVIDKVSLYDLKAWDSFVNGVVNDSEQQDMSVEEYCKDILEDYDRRRTAAIKAVLSLVKDPLRQNISEEIQTEVAREKGIIFKRLPQSGHNALRLYKGKVVKSKNLTKEEKELASKSLDFIITNTGKIIYTYNKYNKWVGGSTDDVYKDVRHLIELINQLEDKTLFFVIILDGQYWDEKRKDFENYQTRNLFITSSDKLDKSILG
jgi:hypothetical protein